MVCRNVKANGIKSSLAQVVLRSLQRRLPLKILLKDIKHDIMKVELRNIDDLWALYNVIQKGDRVLG